MPDETPSEPTPSSPITELPAAPAIPAGWFPDPATGQQRYWDGTSWTEHYALALPAAAPRKSTAPIVLGIIGIVLGFIPGALYVGIVLGIIALILGILAVRAKIARGTAGLVLGSVALVVAALFAAVYAAPLSPVLEESGTTRSVVPKVTPSEQASATPTPTPTPPPAPAKPSPKALTASQEQAAIAAQGYLTDGQGFSYNGLVEQLTSKYGDGFSRADAIVAIKSLHPRWSSQAVIAAKGYLSDGQGFSHNSLLQQLTSPYGGGFTRNEAEYALKKVGL